MHLANVRVPATADCRRGATAGSWHHPQWTTPANSHTLVPGHRGGTGGQLAAALAVGAALVGSVLRFNAMQLMGAVGVGIAAGAGTGIVTGLVGTASA